VSALDGLAEVLADAIAPPSPPPSGGFRDDIPEAFAALNADGTVMCIGYMGEWFFTRKPSIRVRLHNWLVRR
jgi:hypothetical protein